MRRDGVDNMKLHPPFIKMLTLRGNARVQAGLGAVIVMVLWASCYPLITLGLPHAPHLTFAAMRAAIAGSVLLIVAAVSGAPIPKSPRIWAWLMLAGFGATTLGYLGMFHAAEFVAPGFATIIANTQPLLAAMLARFFLAERLHARTKFGLGIGFVGVLISASPQLTAGGGAATAKGVAYVVLAAVGVAIGNIAIKKLAGNIRPSAAMGWQLILGALPLAFMAGLTENAGGIHWAPAFVVSLFTLALFGTALAFWLWQRVLQIMELSRANAFSFLVPFLGVLFGVLFFDERVSLVTIIGAIISIVGVQLTFRNESTIRI